MTGVRTALAALLLCGCTSVQTPSQPEPSASGHDVLIGEPRDARARATAHTELASAYYERGNLGVALDEAKVATQADPSYAPAQNVLGLVYMELKEPTEAQASFERALRIDPQDSDANHNMGWFLCQSGREQDSIKYFLAAIQNPLYKTPAKSYAAAAGCYQKVGHADNALDYYGRALRLDPNFVPALLPYARLQMARGGLDDARAAVTRYNALASPSAESLGLLLQIERRRGDSQAEQSVAAMLGKRFPDSKEYRSFKRGELQ